MFLQTAEEFCSLIENPEDYDPAQFAARCFRLVSKLLTEVFDLPETPLLTVTHRVSTEEYNRIVRALMRILGDKDRFKMVFDPYANDEEVIYGSISDGLSDIWRDLKGGFEALRTGGIEEATGEWRFSFVHHWGSNHATHVLKPLLSLVLEGGWYEREE